MLKKLIFACVICILAAAPTLVAQEAVEVRFHNVPWGTSIEDFITMMRKPPAHTDEIDGLTSLVFDNLIVSGYQAFMVAFFSQNGLECGTYYFNTLSNDERAKCYNDVQRELHERFGPTQLFDTLYREMAQYVSSWNFNSGYVHLKIDTRRNDPVTLWFSSPALTRRIKGS
jgi:hypothetical protein